MDGNNRWAKHNKINPEQAYIKGGDIAWTISEVAADLDIEALTLFTFSLENWKRSKEETRCIFKVIFYSLLKRIDKFNEYNTRLEFIGDLKQLTDKEQDQVQFLKDQTANNSGLRLILAISYSGQWDIVQAVNKIINKIHAGEASIPIRKEDIEKQLALADVPPPDLIIRTGGDMRISNFLLWQIAYSELYFVPTLWPEFTPDQFIDIIENFTRRERRFGNHGLDDNNS